MGRTQRIRLLLCLAFVAGAAIGACSMSSSNGEAEASATEAASEMGIEDHFSGRERELALAAETGDRAAIARLVQQERIDPNRLSALGMPMLLWPVSRRNLAGFEALLDAGADPNRRSAGGEIIMHYVIESGGAEFVRAALAHGARPNQSNRDREPLTHIARRVGDWASVRLLIENGADIDAPGMGLADNTLLGIATGMGDFENAYWLLERGADPSVRLRDAIASDLVGSQPIIEDIYHRPLDPTDGDAIGWQRRCQALLSARGITAPPPPRRFAAG
jgi:hypothetical protein